MSNITRSPQKRRTGRFDFTTFDSLPREVRDAINNAAFNIATTGLGSMVRKSGARTVAIAIATWDQKRVAEAYETREANDFLAELGL